MYAGTTTHIVRDPIEVARARSDRVWYKEYARRKWRTRLLRVVLWGIALALSVFILLMVGSS